MGASWRKCLDRAFKAIEETGLAVHHDVKGLPSFPRASQVRHGITPYAIAIAAMNSFDRGAPTPQSRYLNRFIDVEWPSDIICLRFGRPCFEKLANYSERFCWRLLR